MLRVVSERVTYLAQVVHRPPVDHGPESRDRSRAAGLAATAGSSPVRSASLRHGASELGGLRCQGPAIGAALGGKVRPHFLDPFNLSEGAACICKAQQNSSGIAREGSLACAFTPSLRYSCLLLWRLPRHLTSHSCRDGAVTTPSPPLYYRLNASPTPGSVSCSAKDEGKNACERRKRPPPSPYRQTGSYPLAMYNGQGKQKTLAPRRQD